MTELAPETEVGPPEVRQCQDTTDPQFGAVAIKSDLIGIAWGVFHPSRGGHWISNDAEVENWKVIA